MSEKSENKENVKLDDKKGNESSNNGTHSDSGKKFTGLNEESLRLYPERRGQWEKKWTDDIVYRKNTSQIRCERRVTKVVGNSPLVKLMMSALKRVGCEVDIGRHVCCEVCTKEVTGGYDPELNQIVVCHNQVFSENKIRGILSHEMIHMFDYCRAKFDFNNIEHIACSEIRAANITHCSYLSSVLIGSSSPINIAKTHRNCVKAKAFASVISTHKDLSHEEIWAVIDKVFERCYNDMEPVGRRIRRNSEHMEWAYRERFHYNYDS